MFKKREKETMCQVELGIEKKETQAALIDAIGISWVSWVSLGQFH